MNISGTVNKNPYYYAADLPGLDKWFLMVGFLHNSSYNGTNFNGGIYDVETGKRVTKLVDFKFNETATVVRQRALLYDDSNTLDRQYFYAPRIDALNGSEPTVEELLVKTVVTKDVTKLVFTYDTAGNQTSRKPPSQVAALKAKMLLDTLTPTSLEEEALEDPFEQSIVVYPNPTKGEVTMTWDGQYNGIIKNIQVTDMAGRVIPMKSSEELQEAHIQLQQYPIGVYLVRFTLTDGRTITQKIIKQQPLKDSV